jgi:hypothetical protein
MSAARDQATHPLVGFKPSTTLSGLSEPRSGLTHASWHRTAILSQTSTCCFSRDGNRDASSIDADRPFGYEWVP